MILYVEGDLLASDEKYIAHGCNCSNGFGSGFAKQVADRYAIVKQSYHSRYHSPGWRLGDVQVTAVGDGSGREFANCATQDKYGKPADGPFVSYAAVRLVIKQLVKIWPQGFAMPKIGAGRAGGNWDIIAQIILEECGDVEVRVYVL